jgi:hypothetical protein
MKPMPAGPSTKKTWGRKAARSWLVGRRQAISGLFKRVAASFQPPDWSEEDALFAQLEQEAAERVTRPGWRSLPSDFNQYSAAGHAYVGGELLDIARLRRSNRTRILTLAVQGWAILGGLLLIDVIAFWAAGSNYFRWYIVNGASFVASLRRSRCSGR